MTTPTDKRDPKKSRLPAVVWACCWLTLILGLAFPLICWGGVHFHGRQAIAATALAAGVCWFASVSSLVVASQFRGLQATNGVLLGMLFRMAPPLVACVVLPAQGEWLVRAGGLEIMVIYYLVALTVDTVLSVWLVRNDSGNLKA